MCAPATWPSAASRLLQRLPAACSRTLPASSRPPVRAFIVVVEGGGGGGKNKTPPPPPPSRPRFFHSFFLFGFAEHLPGHYGPARRAHWARVSSVLRGPDGQELRAIAGAVPGAAPHHLGSVPVVQPADHPRPGPGPDRASVCHHDEEPHERGTTEKKKKKERKKRKKEDEETRGRKKRKKEEREQVGAKEGYTTKAPTTKMKKEATRERIRS